MRISNCGNGFDHQGPAEKIEQKETEETKGNRDIVLFVSLCSILNVS